MARCRHFIRRPCRGVSATEGPGNGRVSRIRRPLLVLLALLLMGTGALSVYRSFRAADTGTQAKAALLKGEAHLAEGKLADAAKDLASARDGFIRMQKEIHGVGPLLYVARVTPFVRMQVRGAEAFAGAGRLLADAGLEIADTAGPILAPADPNAPSPNDLATLRRLQASVRSGVRALDTAVDRIAALNGKRLVGPIGSAREDLARRLPRIQNRAHSAMDGLDALVAFSGGAGDRRYLFLSQNPAEPRPTGGYMGTYGVMTAHDGKLTLDRYDGIEEWTRPRPQVAIRPDKAGSPFPFISPPFNQTIANLNNVPDWPSVARAAMDMWKQGGEQPVDGVLSVSTGFLGRLLAVTGPAFVPEYNETVTPANFVNRMDFYAHQGGTIGVNSKDFIGALAEVVLRRVLTVPASQWRALGTVVGQSFDAREAMAWTTDAAASDTLAARQWDGALPAASGDFFSEAPFAFAGKAGRGLKRIYDHSVVAAPDGSAIVTTSITIENTEPISLTNPDSLTYVRLYGPEGATLDSASDPPAALESPIAGHPAAGWFVSAPPLGRTTLKVVWTVPDLFKENSDGTRSYALTWWRVPDHTGDILNLSIQLPAGWRWSGEVPPTTRRLDADISAVWTVVRPSG